MKMANDNNINENSVVMRTAKYLRLSRVEKSLTGTDLGKLLNLSQQQISRYENGQSAISINSLEAYLKVLGKNWMDYFDSVILGNEN
ncbi:helix-turn-helix domain-containing protein [Providencia burhodogranariea]|uniref:Fimbrial operon regulator n=1 Tax=Providencia burhodogranariea DSM 19968 TaxID=1141662 RepID=K8WIN4_9GAMM|nr:helix-turn-helix transcriptional regulator [Providencia burhodogranariea]EKT56095.1 fimbrial operon regulator [Providencia burhodogranariea DSM 19968]